MKKAWLTRPWPHDILRINEFRSGDIIAIGWPQIGDLTGKTYEDIKSVLSGPPYNLTSRSLGNAGATVDLFVNRMNVGDLVLVPNDGDIFFCEICSGYYMDPQFDSPDEGYSHQRKVKWLGHTSRTELSMALRNSLKVHRTAADFSEHYDEIYALSHGMEFDANQGRAETIDVSYPLRRDFSISFQIPADITKEEAQRLSQYFSTLYFTE